MTFSLDRKKELVGIRHALSLGGWDLCEMTGQWVVSPLLFQGVDSQWLEHSSYTIPLVPNFHEDTLLGKRAAPIPWALVKGLRDSEGWVADQDSCWGPGS